jgi:hypothetical protein
MTHIHFLASPLEADIPENMSSKLKGETIPMACSCFLESLWNNQRVNSVHSVQDLDLKQMIRSGKLR